MPGKKFSKTVLPENPSHSGDTVRLKPIMGIRPGHYLACIYGLILLVILFFILVYPGISNPGSVIVVRTEPWGAAILVDGIYKKAAPGEIFVSAGRRNIELRLPGFLPVQVEKDIGSRLFASALFPRKTEISVKLTAPDPAGAFITEAAEFAAWTFAGEPNAFYQIPLSLSEGVYRLAPEASDPAVRKSMDETIAASARFAVTRASLRDLIRAKTLFDNQGLSPSPVSLMASAEDIIGFLSDNPGAAQWLASTLTAEARSAVTSSSWYNAAAQPEPVTARHDSPGGTIQLGYLSFRMIPGGLPLLGNNFPPGTSVETFYISETVISAAAWEAFLTQQPQWREENQVYRETADFFAVPTNAVSGISWYAARAFCEWLTLPPQFAAFEVRLPTEAEWEYAAKFGAINYGRYWEWCEDPFAPLGFLSVSAAAAQALGSPERSVRGGSWINPAGSVGPETRASLPPSFASPFVSFRPVISPRRIEP